MVLISIPNVPQDFSYVDFSFSCDNHSAFLLPQFSFFAIIHKTFIKRNYIPSQLLIHLARQALM